MAGRKNIPPAYKEDWQYKEGDLTVTRTTQYSGPGCHDGCGVLFYTDEEGKLVDIEGDPRMPYNKGRLCMRCLDMLEVVYHEDRILHPLKRVGERGENKWEQITWDEALDLIKEKYDDIVARYGIKAVGGVNGTGRNAIVQGGGIGQAVFGTPTWTSGGLSGESCYHPRLLAMNATIGAAAIADCAQMYEDSFDNPEWRCPDVVAVWGCDPLKSNADGFYGHWIVDLMKQGAKLIVVDPELIWLASRAEVYLPVRPGTDTAVAMAMLNVIISEDLYDHDFVENWTYGFEALAEAVVEWTPERAAEIAWVDADLIVKAARLYATAQTASTQWGVAIDHQKNGASLALALVDLWAITGNIDVPGGNILLGPTPDFRAVYKSAISDLTIETAKRGGDKAEILGYDEFPLRRYNLQGPPSDAVMECMESDYPHPVKMLFIINTNTFANCAAEATRYYEAMERSLEFCVVCDLFRTPTAEALADLILPIAASCERNGARAWWAPFRSMSKVIENGEGKGDDEILRVLGKKFAPEKFPWNSEREFLDFILSKIPSDEKGAMTMDRLEHEVYQYAPWHYRKYEKGLARGDGSPGFNTPTGKVELYVTLYEAAGVPPLPHFEEPSESPVSRPDMAKEYPLVLTTGHRSFEFFHSEHRQLKTMREFHPWPLVDINPADAERYGIEHGEWVWIQNPHGKCKQIANVTDAMREGVVSAEHGWWYPEREGTREDGFFGVFESNINNLTTMCDVGETGYGAPYKTQMCKIYKVTPENEKYELSDEERQLAYDSRYYLLSGCVHEKRGE